MSEISTVCNVHREKKCLVTVKKEASSSFPALEEKRRFGLSSSLLHTSWAFLPHQSLAPRCLAVPVFFQDLKSRDHYYEYLDTAYDQTLGSNKDDPHLTHRPHPKSTPGVPSFVTNDFFVYSKHHSDPTGSRQLKYWKTANLLQDISVRFQKRGSAKNGRRIGNKMADESSDSSNNEDHYR